MATVGNLAPSSADEAKALVPSLDAQAYEARAATLRLAPIHWADSVPCGDASAEGEPPVG